MQRKQKSCPFLPKDCKKEKGVAIGRKGDKNMCDDQYTPSKNPRKERDVLA